jgi:hypothetical protein
MPTLPSVTPAVSNWLQAQRVRRNPEQSAAAPALARLLADRGYPVLQSALDFEALWGGVVWGGEEPHDQAMLGPWAVLTSEAEAFARPHRQELPLVTIAYGPGDSALYIDAAGAIWHQELVEDPAPKRLASSFAELLESLASAP